MKQYGLLIILPLIILGCTGIPATKTILIQEDISLESPTIQLVHHNLNKLKSIRDSLDDGSFLVSSLLSDYDIDCIIHQDPSEDLPQLIISVFEETKHVEFHTEFHGYMALLLRYNGESIYYKNYSYINRQSIHSQRILVPLLSSQLKALAKDIHKYYVQEKK